MSVFDDAMRERQKVDQLTKSVRQTLSSGLPESLPMPLAHAGDADLASDFRERLLEWIREFEANLDEQTEVGARLVSFGQTFTFHLTDVTYWNPALIRFDGISEDGGPIQLI